MSTRSYIGISGPEGPNPTVKFIYCHWDGYPEHNGMMLVKHFDTPVKVNNLIELGDISVLAKTLDGTVSYRRDLSNNNTTAYNAVTVPLKRYINDCDVEYKYLYTEEGEWKCYTQIGDELNFIL